METAAPMRRDSAGGPCTPLPAHTAEPGDYPEPRQPGTRQERMGWYRRWGTGR